MNGMNEVARLSESLSAALKQRNDAYQRVTELNAENKKLHDRVGKQEEFLKDIHAALFKEEGREALHKMLLKARNPERRGEVPDEKGRCTCSVPCGCHPYYQGQECPHCGGTCA